ncbi:sialic acid-specific 9-O-acetylesterase [Bifidobacterium thermophilum RBL67]|uniref:Sialic acid-specific 9-O-acetylesterase n=1 Tax=Bifidobacterium thermophilum RBL67 TaxID=1254439 RepID=M4RDZ9_9BIFI|nr:sialic acid-specific 9-O-acetylesterase [Bifidobacterium thermophilum RBL67]
MLVRYRHAAGLRFDGTVPGTTNADGLDAVSRSAEQSGFELAGADGVFHDAAARIVPDCAVHGGKTGLFSEPGTAGSAASGTTGDTAGEGDGVIRVFSPDVPQPVAIRYAWKSWGPAPVRNADAEVSVTAGRRLKCARVHACSPASSITNWLR